MADYIFPLRERPQRRYNNYGDDRWDKNPHLHHRMHAGCDLHAPVGTEVLAIADGTVRLNPYHFYKGASALEVELDNGQVIRYGEISVNPGLKAGARVRQGECIGRVARMNGTRSSMLHLEMYDGSEEGRLTRSDIPGYERRADTIDPSTILDTAPLISETELSSGGANGQESLQGPQDDAGVRDAAPDLDDAGSSLQPPAVDGDGSLGPASEQGKYPDSDNTPDGGGFAQPWEQGHHPEPGPGPDDIGLPDLAQLDGELVAALEPGQFLDHEGQSIEDYLAAESEAGNGSGYDLAELGPVGAADVWTSLAPEAGYDWLDGYPAADAAPDAGYVDGYDLLALYDATDHGFDADQDTLNYAPHDCNDFGA